MGMKCALFNTPSKLAKGIIACVLGSLSTAANPLTLDWVSAGNNPVGYYYVSPYMARSKARAKSSRCIASISNHEVAPPLEWEANIQTFDLANVPSMQYGNFSSNINSTWVKYEAAAWLITQLTQTSNKYQQAVDQYAAWKIFWDPAHQAVYNQSVAAVGGGFAADVETAYHNAFSAVAGGYVPTGWEVVTPDPAGQPGSTQEFLTPIPEPASILLLATAMIAAGWIVRIPGRRRRNSPVTQRTTQPGAAG